MYVDFIFARAFNIKVISSSENERDCQRKFSIGLFRELFIYLVYFFFYLFSFGP